MPKAQFTIRIDELLLDRVDSWIAGQPVAIARTAVVEAALAKWLDEQVRV